MFQDTILKKLSICPCGFNVLHDHIAIGTKYVVDFSQSLDMILRCGGCHKDTPFYGVLVKNRTGNGEGYLPMDLFAVPTEESK